jgi:hypothetical protein
MPRKLLSLFFVVLFLMSAGAIIRFFPYSQAGAPPYGIAEDQVPDDLDPMAYLRDWKRPDGPPKVGIQVGHWKSAEAPDEQWRLRQNTGGSGGGKAEWEVNMKIAQELSALLQKKGIEVDLLPTTVPEDYWADVFISIHADGSTDSSKSGFKMAGPWRDYSGKSSKLIETLITHYEKATDLDQDPNITRNMRGYYAFSWWRYDHAIHPMTTGVIVETGFLTNRRDQKLLINSPQIPARALDLGITEFLASEGFLDQD